MIAPGTVFVPGTPPPDVNAAFKAVEDGIDTAYPAPKPTNYIAKLSAMTAFSKGASADQVTEAAVTCLNARASSSDQKTNGSTRYAVFGDLHGDMESEVIDPYFQHGKPWPTNAFIQAVITGSGSPAAPPLPSSASNAQIAVQVNQNTKDIAALKAKAGVP